MSILIKKKQKDFAQTKYYKTINLLKIGSSRFWGQLCLNGEELHMLIHLQVFFPWQAMTLHTFLDWIAVKVVHCISETPYIRNATQRTPLLLTLFPNFRLARCVAYLRSPEPRCLFRLLYRIIIWLRENQTLIGQSRVPAASDKFRYARKSASSPKGDM